MSALFLGVAPCRAQNGALSPREEAVETAPPASIDESDEEEQRPGIYAGGELFLGRTNLEGAERLRDGFWPAGSGPSYPSALYLRVLTSKQVEAKVSVGVGRLFRDAAYGFEQPIEAWARVPLGKSQETKLTAGKFYVPFALQEWEYETKWGAMIEHQRGKTALAVAATRNSDTKGANIYARAGRDVGGNANFGLSLAGGKGLSYGSEHDRALGIDFSITKGGWNGSGEQLWMKGPNGQRFRFTWMRLAYANLGKLEPFIARYRWNDNTDAFGNIRSTAVGAGYQFTPELALELGYTFSSEEDSLWAQLHWAGERRIAALGADEVVAPLEIAQAERPLMKRKMAIVMSPVISKR